MTTASATLPERLAVWARADPDRTFLRMPGAACTYREADEAANAIGHGLRELGVKPGDLVVVMQHIELGIAEGNVVGLLGELGLTWARDGQPLLPIGTLYDPFVNRALEPWSFGLYAGGQSILVGTPSGVTLAPEGGAHHSITTPSVGLEQPRCIAAEVQLLREHYEDLKIT